ncbi:MAG: hypothetical protein ACXV2A_02435 [Halobacteriota archaeon]
MTNEEADLLCRVLEGVKTKTFEESNITLDDMGALKALVANFKQAEKLEPEKEACQKPVNSLGKRLFLGNIIIRDGYTDTASGNQGLNSLSSSLIKLLLSVQLKPIAVITVLLLVVVSLSIAGCTSSTTSTASPGPADVKVTAKAVETPQKFGNFSTPLSSEG